MGQRSNTQSSGIVPIAIRNTTAETIPAYGVVAIGSGSNKTPNVFTRSGTGVGAGRAIVPVRKPDAVSVNAGNTSLFLINTDTPIPPDQVGYATASTPTWAKANGTLDERGMSVGPQAGSWELQKGAGFWTALDVKTIGANKYAFVVPSTLAARVFLSPSGGIPARAGTTLGQATCARVRFNGSAIVSTIGDTETVRNLSTEAVAGSAYIQCLWIEGTWLANWEQCE